MYQELARKAIQAALSHDWETAVSVNLEILSDSPEDVDALNRISQAYMRIGNFSDARDTAMKVFEIDPLNSIAAKCIDRCELLEGRENEYFESLSPAQLQDLFIEEPGKTKIVSLINICEASNLAILCPGQLVNLIPRQRRVIVTSGSDSYIGKLPDDLSIRIIYFVNQGRQYTSHIKSVARDDVKIFIRDISNGLSEFQTKSFKV